MSLSKQIATYADVQAIFDKVVELKQPLKYKLANYKTAYRWQLRAYHFRTLLQKQEAARLKLDNYQVSTPYDALQISHYDQNGTLLIKYQEVEGKLMDEADVPVSVQVNKDGTAALTADPDQELIEELKQQVLPDKDPL